MKISIINISNKMPSWVNNACDEYLVRINNGKYSCKIIEIKADKKNNKSTLDNMQDEAKKILNHIPNGSFIIVLDEKGKNYTSTSFAKELDNISIYNTHIVFIIGGCDGTHPSLKTKSHLIIQLSSLTYPHALVRVVLLEQIYRAISILNNHPYHRE